DAFQPWVTSRGPPAAEVADNRNIRILTITDSRLWSTGLTLAYLRPFDAIVCTGSDIDTQWRALKLRALLRQRVLIIHTFEGLAGSMRSDCWEREYTEAAGHPVYCNKIPERLLRRIDDSWQIADHIIAISPFLARLATARYGDKVSMLPLGVDTALFRRTS